MTKRNRTGPEPILIYTILRPKTPVAGCLLRLQKPTISSSGTLIVVAQPGPRFASTVPGPRWDFDLQDLRPKERGAGLELSLRSQRLNTIDCGSRDTSWNIWGELGESKKSPARESLVYGIKSKIPPSRNLSINILRLRHGCRPPSDDMKIDVIREISSRHTCPPR